MRLRHFALTEVYGLAVDLSISFLLIFYIGVDPLAARLPGALAGLATSWRLNHSNGDGPNELNGFLFNAVTLISRMVGVGLFALLQLAQSTGAAAGPARLFGTRGTGAGALRL
ncbi:hypothetical protein QE432_002951 [Agrobacterium sp. SORGH_AS 745]|nr:hypothetical protein [Agrobacterium sp. SORGH_AS_0745]